MKKLRDILIAVVIISGIGFLLYVIYDSTNPNKELAKRMAEISPRGGPPETIEGLIKAIKLYEEQHQRNIKDAAQTGVYWKILAMRYNDRNMFNNALEALEWAIYYNGGDPFLFNLRGSCAAAVARNSSGLLTNTVSEEKEKFLKIAESAYLRALELDATYTRAMYGLAYIYTVELNRQEDAILYLERYLQIQKTDINAMALLARAYFLTKSYTRAIEMYDRIANRTSDMRIKEEALNNKYVIQGMMYE